MDKKNIKSIFLLFLLGLVFLSGILVYRNSEKLSLALLELEEENKLGLSLEREISLKNQALRDLVYDYSGWDEMAIFMITRDNAWAEANLAEIFSSDHLQALWIYDANFNPLYFTCLPEISLPQELLFSADILNQIFAKQHFCNFFINTASGLWQIQGASIHFTSDLKRQTPAQGYFLVGRIWNEDFMKEIAKALKAKVFISPLTKIKDLKKELKLKKEVVVFAQPLRGWDNKAVAQLNIWKIDPLIQDFLFNQKNLRFLGLILIICFGLGVYIFMLYQQDKTLELILKTLNTIDLKFVNHLLPLPNKMGQISRALSKIFKEDLNRSQEIESLNQQLNEQIKASSTLETELKNLEDELNSARQEINHLNQELQNQINYTQKIEASLRQEKDNLEIYLKAQIQEKENTIFSLQNEIKERQKLEEDLTQQRQALLNQLEERSQQIQSLNQKLKKETDERKYTEELMVKLISSPEQNQVAMVEIDNLGHIYYLNAAAKQLFPEIETTGFQHPFLAGLEEKFEVFKKEGRFSLEREIKIGSHHYYQMLSYISATGHLRIYALDITALKMTESL